MFPPLHRMSQLDVELDFTMSKRKSQTNEFLKKRAVRAVSLSTGIGNHIPSHLILNSIFPGQKPLDIGLTFSPPHLCVRTHTNTKCRVSIPNCRRWNTFSRKNGGGTFFFSSKDIIIEKGQSVQVKKVQAGRRKIKRSFWPQFSMAQWPAIFYLPVVKRTMALRQEYSAEST